MLGSLWNIFRGNGITAFSGGHSLQGITNQPDEGSSTSAPSPQADICMKMVQDLMIKQEQLTKEKEEVKDRLIKEKEEVKDRLSKEKEELKDRLIQEKEEVKDRLIQEKEELKEKLHKEKMSHLEDKINYGKLRSEWLRACRSLSSRRVFEVFEKENLSTALNETRYKKWNDFLASKKTKALEIKEVAGQKLLDLDSIPKIASSLYRRLSEDIHKGYDRGDKVVIKTRYLSKEQAQLMRMVCILLPIHEDDIEEDDSPMNPILEKSDNDS